MFDFPIGFSVVELIQAMLAPGIMISACGLLLLGMNNKYSLVVGRIRLLNEEKRRFFKQVSERELAFEEEVRLKSIATQLQELYLRVKLVRNAVLCYSSAVGVFVLTSIIIGVSAFVQSTPVLIAGFSAFCVGMVLVLAGVVFAAKEVIKGYQIVGFEIKADE